jgi:hypothetical protein
LFNHDVDGHRLRLAADLRRIKCDEKNRVLQGIQEPRED